MYKISQPDTASALEPVPTIAEQQPTLTAIDTFGEEALAALRAVELGLKQSTAQRQNILRAAFSGQLVPQDEPATALLARKARAAQ